MLSQRGLQGFMAATVRPRLQGRAWPVNTIRGCLSGSRAWCVCWTTNPRRKPQELSRSQRCTAAKVPLRTTTPRMWRRTTRALPLGTGELLRGCTGYCRPLPAYNQKAKDVGEGLLGRGESVRVAVHMAPLSAKNKRRGVWRRTPRGQWSHQWLQAFVFRQASAQYCKPGFGLSGLPALPLRVRPSAFYPWSSGEMTILRRKPGELRRSQRCTTPSLCPKPQGQGCAGRLPGRSEESIGGAEFCHH